VTIDHDSVQGMMLMTGNGARTSPKQSKAGRVVDSQFATEPLKRER